MQQPLRKDRVTDFVELLLDDEVDQGIKTTRRRAVLGQELQVLLPLVEVYSHSSIVLTVLALLINNPMLQTIIFM